MKCALVMLVGCNAWFGNDPVLRFDAQRFDAQVDAPTPCPSLGTPPAFGTALHQQILQNCMGYSFNSERASAICFATGGPAAYEGPTDDKLSLVTELYDSTSDTNVDEVALSSDAQTVYARRVNYSTGTLQLIAAQRMPGGTWQLIAMPPFGQNPNDGLGSFARGPTGDHVLIVAGDLRVHEWVEDGGAWTDARVHPFPPVYGARMTANGLRVALHGMDGSQLYSDRPDVDSMFSTPVTFSTAPPAPDTPMLSEGCDRLYVAGLESVFYVER